ncbi:sulfur carrier protein ThiS [Denitromonas halophila]|uniref:sulfur carrier protein ThiS n=1 Tax=Denitromonas halophila TaxID=1629404 RepID=UPI001C9145F4|nr:sulfur carrier protein ThiS [Denitromonas halophila]
MNTIQIELNGRPHPADATYTLADLVAKLGLAGKSLAISINREVIKRGDWPQRRIEAADRIEIVHAIGGG